MARLCRIGRRKVVVAVVCMWSSILQQYACLLMDVYMLMLWLRGESTERRRPEHRIPLPLSRAIYRIGFLAYTTRTTDISCINLLQMKRSIFWSLCELLRDGGGLTKTNNMFIDEMLAIFLVTIGHNTKNRTVQALFHRSAETITRTIRKVLLAILKLHDILIEKPVPVPKIAWMVDGNTSRQNMITNMEEDQGSSKPPRDYKIWTEEEVRVFIKVMVDLVELKQVENTGGAKHWLGGALQPPLGN
ncbi:hypothetical protein LINPERPRIM_LOCUS29740 [Linum perenne]